MSRPKLTGFEGFFRKSPLGCALCDMEGRFLRVNQAFADLIGFRLSEVLRLSDAQITPKEFKRAEAVRIQKLSEKGAFGPYDKALLHREGFLVPVSTWSWLVESGGQDFILSVAEERHRHAEHAIEAPAGKVTRDRRADPEWSEAKNARRCELIDRKIQNTISTREATELDELQEALRAYLDRVAPLPMEGPKKLHAELVHLEKGGVKGNAGV
jgi:PAS domain S-box-containing protein